MSRPRVHSDWPAQDERNCDKRGILVDWGFDREKWDVEVGGVEVGGGGGEEELFEESDNYPFFKQVYYLFIYFIAFILFLNTLHQDFIGNHHVTFGGSGEAHGPVVVSMKPAPQQIIRESPVVSGFTRGAAFVIVRTIVRDERLVIPFKVKL